MVVETFGAEETFALGRKIGEAAVPGQVYALNGDLGVGKTVFTQGVAKGLGIEGAVSSPTFTILQIYEEGRLPFYDEYFYGDGICLIEWAELIEDILPDHCRKITISKDLCRGMDYRKIIIEDECRQ